MAHTSGRHFLQLPGPSNVPERVLRAMDRAVIDHRGPAFATLLSDVLAGLQRVFRTEAPVLVFPASGTGGWEAALANTLSPGDRVLAFDQGHFARRWTDVAARLGLDVDLRPGDWRAPLDPDRLRDALREDAARRVRAVLVVHNETSTGVTSDVAAARRALDDCDHPALLLVDAVSSVGCTDVRHDDWGVDVTVAASQKGFMLPPGLAFNVVGPRALDAAERARLPRSYWRWERVLEANARGVFPYSPATTLLFGLAESIRMLEEEGLQAVFARHRRFADATLAAVDAWGLDPVAQEPATRSASVTAVFVPPPMDADELRRLVLERFDMSLGKGLGLLEGRAFRIGHLGDLNALTLIGALAGVEMGLEVAGVPHRAGGVQAAMHRLAEAPQGVPA